MKTSKSAITAGTSTRNWWLLSRSSSPRPSGRTATTPADRTSFSLTGQTVLPRLPGLLLADDRLFYGMVVLPNCFISLVSDHVIVHRFEPVAPDRTLAVCEWLFPAQTIEAGRYDVADTVALFGKVNEQDF